MSVGQVRAEDDLAVFMTTKLDAPLDFWKGRFPHVSVPSSQSPFLIFNLVYHLLPCTALSDIYVSFVIFTFIL